MIQSVRSLKRKREEDEVEEAAPEVAAPLEITKEPVICSPPHVVDDISLPDVSIPEVPIAQVPVFVSVPEVGAPEVPSLEPTRPKKRARTAMHTVARTAAAMAIGAAATWSALAFS